MATMMAMPKPHHSSFSTDNDRWSAVIRRDPAADGIFVYSVRTTGVYCRPVCPARRPRRENVHFHATCAEAHRAGFRPCKRCRPGEPGLVQRRAAAVADACRRIEMAAAMPSLDSLAQSAGMSRFHFHRVFKAVTGVTPKAYAEAQRTQRIRDGLLRGGRVTGAIYGAGFNSNGRFYASSAKMLGMKPAAFRAGGTGELIRFAVGECSLGAILVAATKVGVCAVLLGDEADALVRELQDRFPKAELTGGDRDFEQTVAKVVGLVESPRAGVDLPLDVRGTAFQQKVWLALRDIPAGTTASYSEIAKRIGKPKSARAVARACASNAIAVVIPCHRVVRTDGSLSGYSWGVERKRSLLDCERKCG